MISLGVNFEVFYMFLNVFNDFIRSYMIFKVLISVRSFYTSRKCFHLIVNEVTWFPMIDDGFHLLFYVFAIFLSCSMMLYEVY